MNIQIHNKYVATFVIGLIWLAAMVIQGNILIVDSTYSNNFLFVYIVAMLLTLRVIHLYRPNTAGARQRKVEKLLSDLDNEERSILFNRLATSSNDIEYESLEALLNEQKRKRS